MHTVHYAMRYAYARIETYTNNNAPAFFILCYSEFTIQTVWIEWARRVKRMNKGGEEGVEREKWETNM